MKDACGCCDVCGKVFGEECGGLWNMNGKCGRGLKCDQGEGPLRQFPGSCKTGE